MKKKKFLLGFSIAAAAAIALASCGKSNKDDKKSSTAAESSQITEVVSSTTSEVVSSTSEAISSVVSTSTTKSEASSTSSAATPSSSSTVKSEASSSSSAATPSSSSTVKSEASTVSSTSSTTTSSSTKSEASTVSSTTSSVSSSSSSEVTTSSSSSSTLTTSETSSQAQYSKITMNNKEYDTIAAAIAAIPTSGDTSLYTIHVPKGTYDEKGLSYKGAASIEIVGDTTTKNGADVIIQGTGKDQNTTRTRPLLEMDGTGNLILSNITLKNTFTRVGATTDFTQCEALGHDSTGTVAAYNCSFISHQDTIRTVSKAWFYGCYIEGDVDFLWCEASSIVALYEKCEIVAVADESEYAYVAAPKYSYAKSVGKGLVIYNSTVTFQNGFKGAYLFRNPWSSSSSDDVLNTVSYVGTTVTGTVTDLAKSNALSKTDNLGYHIDTTLANSLKDVANTKGVNTMSDDLKAKEYAGRNNIVNRMYDHSTGKFGKDLTKNWDLNELALFNNWTVDADDSKDLLDGEVEIQTVTYKFDGSEDQSALCSGFAQESGKSHYVGNSGATITIPLTGKCTVSVTGYYKGSGTIKAGTQADVSFDFTNGSTSKFLTKDYIVYDENATEVVIAATGTSYITQIVVAYDSTLTYNAVESIGVAAKSNIPQTVGVPYSLVATVNPSDASNKDVVWSSSDSEIATVNVNGVVTFLKAGEVVITATAKDGSGVEGQITLNPEAATWTEAEWYFSADKSSSAAGSGVGLATTDIAGANCTAFTSKNTSGITLGRVIETTLLDGTTANISTGLKMDSNGQLTISVTKNATLVVKQAYIEAGTKTYPGILKITASKGTATAASTNPTSNVSADTEYVWYLTEGTYVIERVTGNTGAIYYAAVSYDKEYVSSLSYDWSKVSADVASGDPVLSTDEIKFTNCVKHDGQHIRLSTDNAVEINLAKGATLTVSMRYTNGDVKVNGEVVALVDSKLIYTAEEDETVVITGPAGNAYIQSITVTKEEAKDPATAVSSLSYVWADVASTVDDGAAVPSTDEITFTNCVKHDGTYIRLSTDNAVKITVAAGKTLTVNMPYSTGVTVNGTAVTLENDNLVYTATEDTEVVITGAAGNAYITSITVA